MYNVCRQKNNNNHSYIVLNLEIMVIMNIWQPENRLLLIIVFYNFQEEKLLIFSLALC